MTDAVESPDRRSEVIQAAVAEFNVLRKEISDRSSAQTTILNLNLTALSAIAALVLADRADPLVLLVLPLLSSCFGMLFFDHAANIDQIGRYLREEVQAMVTEAVGDPRLFCYEERVRAYELSFVPRGLSMGVPLLLMFTGFPVAALAFSWQRVSGGGWPLFLWWAGIVLQLGFLVHWLAFVRRPFVSSAR